MKNKLKICLNIDKYQLFLRNRGERSRAGPGNSGAPCTNKPQTGVVRSLEHTTRHWHFTPRDRLVWMLHLGLVFSVKSRFFSEGQRIPGHVLNTMSVLLKGLSPKSPDQILWSFVTISTLTIWSNEPQTQRPLLSGLQSKLEMGWVDKVTFCRRLTEPATPISTPSESFFDRWIGYSLQTRPEW